MPPLIAACQRQRAQAHLLSGQVGHGHGGDSGRWRVPEQTVVDQGRGRKTEG